MSAETLGKLFGQEESDLLMNEGLVLDALHFDMITHPPYRAIDGFFQVKYISLATDSVLKCYLCPEICRRSCLLHSPTQCMGTDGMQRVVSQARSPCTDMYSGSLMLSTKVGFPGRVVPRKDRSSC